MNRPGSNRAVNENFINQIKVLRAMSERTSYSDSLSLHIDEIAELSGVKDEKEIQRYLFILEGQKLVSPQPEGDFTSKSWSITKDGIRIVKKAISSNFNMAA